MDTATITGLRVEDAIAMPRADECVVAHARREEQYAVHVTRDADATDAALRERLDGVGTVAVIADETVDALYGVELRSRLRALDVDVLARTVPAGEHSKSLDRAVELWHWLAESPLGRRDLVLCFGGGVICDMGGWVASVYMRGVPYVNLPTTLLAMVDGALGGKVAVNHPVAKNLLGAFQQPAGVVCQLDLLRSLEARQLGAGIAECIKKGVIASPAYFAFIERAAPALMAGDASALEALVRAAAAIKTALIERDPYEVDLRRPLNFGHTIGHPLETVTGYAPLLHGEAVAFGMAVEATVAARRGWLDDHVLDRLLRLLDACGLPAHADALPPGVTADALITAMEKVRLIRAGSLRWVLPVALGETVIADDVTEAEVRAALADCGVR
ncbi:3-dehydroquinate synthase [Solirubrobacter phytolaccae]|uniref:3-dehydroquinate synthase n=1 Tax=Solirubrobacter phytolaccae TaxID=1404360 RepID=A0A9X3NFL5_9ACTN|nr:3-dehydroquinate synthase family protein [Solirubrobacter phytolaccae]MDA0184374.1 3-dehydroquinate synthase [Solirubrobacter phytolaccae]